MPNNDATGPAGMGPRTGRGMGPCGGGVGWRGRGFGCERGFGRRGFWSITKEDQKKVLEEEAKYLREDLEAIEKELGEIDK